MYILDNKRLKDLWNVGKNFQIGGGKAFFHFNPYLCLDKIKKITNLTKALEDSNDVSQTTNGDRVACNLFENFLLAAAWLLFKFCSCCR